MKLFPMFSWLCFIQEIKSVQVLEASLFQLGPSVTAPSVLRFTSEYFMIDYLFLLKVMMRIVIMIKIHHISMISFSYQHNR